MAEKMIHQFHINEGIADFETIFDTEKKCLKFLAEIKWKDGFICQKCGHDHYCKGNRPYSRRCTKCKTLESATANTLFHKCKIPLTTAFKIFYMVCKDQAVTSQEISEALELRKMTCWKFKKKIEECIKHSSVFSHSMKTRWKEILMG